MGTERGTPWWVWVLVALGAAVVIAGAFATGRNTAEPTKVPPAPVSKESAEEIETPVGETEAGETPETNDTLPEPYESEGGVPYTGVTWTTDVAPKEIEVYTCGPARVAGVELSGGENRGSVIIVLPSTKVVHYTIADVIAGSGWHGAYSFEHQPSETDWQALVNNRVAAMKKAPNCAAGNGCSIVDILVIGPGPLVVDQWTE